MSEQDIFLRNNTGSKSKSAIVDGFVVRTNEFDYIKDILVNGDIKSKSLNTIIIGQRGAGKTTLMHRLNYAILDEKLLSDIYLPIIFSEEQYNLSDLTNLWEAIAMGIDDNFYKEKLSDSIEKIIDTEEDYEKASFSFLQKFLKSKNKTAILFIENVNFFLKKLNEYEKKRLKSILTSESHFRIIGSSTSFNDGTIDFGDPFYKFFNTVQLDGLNQQDCEKLLIKIGQQYGEENQIKEIIENYPGRVEALRRLTGGVPRTISYLFQIFLDNENGKAIKDLYLLIDTLTLLYKSELDQLSTQQQKVIDAIARKWDAISVKEIAKRTRLESKNISSILSYLEKNQLIEKVPTSTKNHLYRIKERFMNIWYLMRFGRKHDKENVIWLVRFFDAWCDESELTKRLKNHISNLKDGKYDAVAAIDMGNTFLSCENIPENLKEELISTTNSILPDRILKGAKTAEKDVLDDIKKLLKDERFDEAVSRLNDVENKDIDYFMLATSVYLMQGDHEKALDAAKSAWNLDDQNTFTSTTLGVIYDMHLNDPDKAIEYYEKSLTLPHPHPYAANRLGSIYKKRKDYESAIKYHKQAVTKNFKQSLISLGNIYLDLNDFEMAEKYFRDAVEAKLDKSNTALAKLFSKMKKKKDAEIALLNAVKENEEDSNINLGRLYMFKSKPSFKKAEEQFKLAIDKGEIDGYTQLARLYLRQKQNDMAIAVLENGVSHNDAESAHQLAHLFHREGLFEKSDKMFEKAIELGDTSVIGCWVQSIYRSKRNNRKKFTKELLEKYKPDDINSRFELLYAKILLWNDNLTEAIGIVKKQAAILHNSTDDDSYAHRNISELVEFFLLLIAKREYDIALDMFSDNNDLDLRTMLKPIYYLMMNELKEDYPMEYLKAGKELTETINDLKKEVENLRKK
ncbi:tetratricopeptide repeat protein [Myroides sp. 1354]|uniref:tetratricopeptide repeat protein n=1 Tax=unclassified Myroides TaxID=2642485 RepID=UPI002576F0B6|nr:MULTISPECIES: tetratricopeptide repeat protein [unclassified Myroides]MDM1044736.1 tetratricopeptide repeat protein [Myroides sp. R163-1]MDM1055449.1 tetratricopeptide repeat protein [Myroides sp. 1354]MDM1068746.1 tetratricopeptide repeat protein [Myroides sp. 1372]